MQKLIILIAATILISCSPQKRLNNLIDKYPGLLSQITDTNYYPVITQQTIIDTSIITNTQDTFIITKNNLTTQIIRSYDTILINSTVYPDTFYIREIIKYTQPDLSTKTKNNNQYWLIALFLFLALLIIGFINKIFFK